MNNTIHFLKVGDFHIAEGKKGRVLCTNLKGVSFVMFYSKECVYCNELFPIFKRLSQQIPNCSFAALNISNEPGVVYASQKTIAKIDSVPYLVLYVQGRPFVRYTGSRKFEDVGNFIVEILKRVQSKKNFMDSKYEVVEAELPRINGLIPFNISCEGEQCYVKFGDLYKK